MSSRKKNSIRNIGIGLASQLLLLALSFVSRAVFVRYLSAEYLGINGLFTNILSLLSLAELGVGTAIIYSLYKPIAEKDTLKIQQLMNFYKKAYMVIGISVLGLGLLLLPSLAFFIQDAPDIVESIYVIYLFYLFNTVITYFFAYKSSILLADQKNYITIILNNIAVTVQTILQITILVVTQNFLLYLLAQSIMIFMYNLSVAVFVNRKYPYLRKSKAKLPKPEQKELFYNIYSLMSVKIGQVLVNNTDNLIISLVSGLSQVGFVSNYNLVLSAMGSILSQVFSGFTGSIGNHNATANQTSKYQLFNVMLFLNFWFYGFASIVFLLVGNDLITLWLGQEYVLSQPITIILVINFYMLGMLNSVLLYKNTLGLFKHGKHLLLLTAVINLVLSFVLGSQYGLVGVFAATAIARILTNAWYHPYVVYKHGLGKNVLEYFLKYGLYTIVAIVSLVVAMSIANLVIVQSFMTLVAKTVIVAVVVNMIFIGCFFRTKEFKYLLGNVKKLKR